MLDIDDGDIITSAGAAAGIDMLLHMIRRDLGDEAANAAARGMVVASHREGGQRQFITGLVGDPDIDRLSRAMEHVRANPCIDLDVAKLADVAGMSRRTFFRHFQRATGLTPQDWITRERVAMAREMLERSEVHIEQLAYAVGFGTDDLLRHHLRRVNGVAPTVYRRNCASNAS